MGASGSGPARQTREPDWLTVDEARERILATVSRVGVEKASLAQALGRVLAADVESSIRHPGWDNAAMDGFAVLSNDVRGASRDRPVVLRVV